VQAWEHIYEGPYASLCVPGLQALRDQASNLAGEIMYAGRGRKLKAFYHMMEAGEAAEMPTEPDAETADEARRQAKELQQPDADPPHPYKPAVVQNEQDDDEEEGGLEELPNTVYQQEIGAGLVHAFQAPYGVPAIWREKAECLPAVESGSRACTASTSVAVRRGTDISCCAIRCLAASGARNPACYSSARKAARSF
jgi:hypothetical protein